MSWRRNIAARVKPVEIDGIRFATKSEADRYLALKDRAARGDVTLFGEMARTNARITFGYRSNGRACIESFNLAFAKPNKYKAKKTVLDGITFDSGREAKRYRELTLLVRAGQIDCLERQPVYPILVAGRAIATYRGDFRYVDKRSGSQRIEDAKGMRTPVYKLKKKLVEAIYGITIVEV
jgi:hypothetical protein